MAPAGRLVLLVTSPRLPAGLLTAEAWDLLRAHPVYTPAGVEAQREHATISGLHSRTHYCGAYWGWGFHEDGVASAHRAVAALGREAVPA